MSIITSLTLTEEQFKFMNDFKWNYRIPKTEVYRAMITYFMNNPDKLKEIIKEGLKDD